MSPARARRLAWGLAALVIAMEIGYYAVGLATGLLELVLFNVIRSVFIVVFAALGALVATRQARNAIGWICLGVALSSGLFDLAYALVDDRLHGGGDAGPLVEVAAACVNVGWAPGMFVPATFLLLLFPDGRLPSRRWRLVAWCAAAGIVAFIFAYGATPGPLDNFHSVQNPFGGDSSVLEPLTALGGLLVGVAIVASAVSVAVRFRDAGHVQRQQIKWLATAGAVVAITLIARLGLNDAIDSDVSNSVLLSALLCLPVAIGIAILRHRLYDIDVVINRALVYGALSATLAGTYLGSILLLQLVLSGVTADNGLVIAASTLAVAALFQPARRRIQAGVDRRFYRRKYDAARTLERFGAQLRVEVDLDALGSELRTVVGEAMQPAHVSLWLRQR